MKARTGLVMSAWLLSLGGVGAGAYLNAGSAAVVVPAAGSTAAVNEALTPSLAPSDELRRLKETLAALQTRQERTEAALTRLSGTLAALSAGEAGSERSSGTTSAVKRKPLTSAQIAQINRQQREKDAERLSDDFQTQASDSAWAPQTAALIAERLNNPQTLPGVDLVANECREALCRLEVVVDDAEQKVRFEEQLPLLLGEILPNTTMFDEPQPDGSIRSVIYLGRGNG